MRRQSPPAGGRDEEFREFARSRASPLHQSAYLLCGDWHLAHDLVQDTLVKAYQHWPRVRRADSPDAYVRRILLNEVRGRWRRRDRTVPVARFAEAEPVGRRDRRGRPAGRAVRGAAGAAAAAARHRRAALPRGPVRAGDRGGAGLQPGHRQEPERPRARHPENLPEQNGITAMKTAAGDPAQRRSPPARRRPVRRRPARRARPGRHRAPWPRPAPPRPGHPRRGRRGRAACWPRAAWPSAPAAPRPGPHATKAKAVHAAPVQTAAYVAAHAESALARIDRYIIRDRSAGQRPLHAVDRPADRHTYLIRAAAPALAAWGSTYLVARVMHWRTTQLNYGPRTWWTQVIHAAGPIQGATPAGPYGGAAGTPAQIRASLSAGHYRIIGHRVINGHRAIGLKGPWARGYLEIWVDAGSYQPVRVVIADFADQPGPLRHDHIAASESWVARSPALVQLVNHPRIPAGFTHVPAP